MKRFALGLAAISMAAFVGACGSDSDTPPCVGHGCGDALAPFGGQVLLEYLLKPDGSEVAKVTAWFTSAHDGNHPTLPEPGPSGAEPSCINYSTTDAFPRADVDGEVNIDVGDSITISNGTLDMVLTRNEAGVDGDFVQHDVLYTYVDTNPVPAAFHDANWTVTLEENGEVYEDILTGAIYSPTNFTLNSPTFDAGYSIDRSSDLDVEWTAEPDPTDIAAEAVDALVAFLDPNTGLHTLCLSPADEGTMTISSAIVADVPDAGVFLVGKIAHNQKLNADNRVTHLLGRNCWVGPYTAQ